MVLTMQEFLTNVLDAAWVTELLLISFSWVLLCARRHRIGCTWKPFRVLGNTAGLFLALVLVNVVINLTAAENYFHMLWNTMLGVVTAVYFWNHTDYHREIKLVLW